MLKTLYLISFFFLASAQTTNESLDLQEYEAIALIRGGSHLTQEEARSLEEKLDKDPAHVFYRAKLTGFYSDKRFQDPSAREAYQEHVLWFIQNTPKSGIHSQVRLDLSPDAAAYHGGKAVWLDHLSREPNDLKILENSAFYFLMTDRELALKSLERAKTIDKDSPKWPRKIGQLYWLERRRGSLNVPDPVEKALEEFETAYALSDDREKNHLLRMLAQASLEAGQMQKAKAYATRMVNDNISILIGNSHHFGNIVLGRLALKEGEPEKAKGHLIEAGKTTGSPVLNSFGPSMALARELLQIGEKEVVLKYFELCARFWESGHQRLEEWAELVEAGGIPDFGGNEYR